MSLLETEMWNITQYYAWIRENCPENLTVTHIVIRDYFHDKLQIPPGIGRLSNLKVLNLPNNGITLLPDEIGNLHKLEMLILSNNKLTSLPDDIGKLQNLKILSLLNNKLSSFPLMICNIRNLESFWE